MSVIAEYELPVPIWISDAAFTTTHSAGYRHVKFNVLMPSLDGAVGTRPVIEGVELPPPVEKCELVTWAQRYAAFLSDNASTALCRVILQTEGGDVDGSRDPYDLALAVDPWFDAVRTWVETMTGQDLDPNHRVFSATVHGSRLVLLDPPPVNDTPIALSLETPRVIPLPAAAWSSLLAKVAAGEPPPLEEVLSRDSRAAFARGQLRRSIIDAASAAEIVLFRSISAELSASDMPSSRLRGRFEALGKQPLGGLVTIAEEGGLDLQVDVDSLKRLAHVRNDAIHRGAPPDGREAYDVVQAAIELLARRGRWKREESLPDFGDEWELITDDSP